MTSRTLVPFILAVLLSSLFVGAHPAAADSSHARIIRLSLVQRDVRFPRPTHGDPLADAKATSETPGLNLPTLQEYVLAPATRPPHHRSETAPTSLLSPN